MIRAELGLGILGTALWVYCLFDVIMADESRIRNLSKGTWIFIVLVTSVVGAVAWLVAGRPEGPARSLPYKGNTGRPAPYAEYDRPGRFAATNPDDDEAFLRQVRERAEEQMREAKRQRAEREARERAEWDRERQRRQGASGVPSAGGGVPSQGGGPPSEGASGVPSEAAGEEKDEPTAPAT